MGGDIQMEGSKILTSSSPDVRSGAESEQLDEAHVFWDRQKKMTGCLISEFMGC